MKNSGSDNSDFRSLGKSSDHVNAHRIIKKLFLIECKYVQKFTIVESKN